DLLYRAAAVHQLVGVALFTAQGDGAGRVVLARGRGGPLRGRGDFDVGVPVDGGEGSNSLLYHRPFVENAGALHEDALRGHRNDMLVVVVDAPHLREVVLGCPPT